MARPLRVEFPGALYHVTGRGNARQEVYLDDADRASFLSTFAAVSGRTGWRCHAYCLMPNHYHLVIETPVANLGRGMRQLNGVYTQAFNRAHDRVGHLFQGRYKAILVEREPHLLELARYVVLNPVRAGLVRRARQWRWSSYRATVGEVEAPPWLDTDGLLARFGHGRDGARAAYARFVREGRHGASPWGALRRQTFLGSETFVEDMLGRVEGSVNLAEVPRAQWRAVPKPLSWYARRAGTPHEAMARAYASGDYSQVEIARYFGVHYSTVSRAARRHGAG